MTISSILNSYYQLGSASAATTGTGTTTNSSPLLSPTQQLISDLQNADSSNSNNQGGQDNNAYSLNLSQQAQSLLNGTGTSTQSSGFTLTTAQQQKITAILEKYQSSPMTQATYEQIQNDLQAAGLSPDQLMANDITSSFNPVDSLISALNGNYSTQSASTTLGNEQTKATNYMQAIVKQWQSISTATSDTNSTTS